MLKQNMLRSTLLIILSLAFSLATQAQIKFVSNSKLSIEHGDITLFLTRDTLSVASIHHITREDFRLLDNKRDNRWFQDTYKTKYNKKYYTNSGYDLGHLTPSHITSYNDTLNHASFSYFNQAPQLAAFNRGKWSQLEKLVEDSVGACVCDAIIITGVIYGGDKTEYLSGSKIRIPIAFFKALYLGGRYYYWVGSNVNGEVISIDLRKLNQLFVINQMGVRLTIGK